MLRSNSYGILTSTPFTVASPSTAIRTYLFPSIRFISTRSLREGSTCIVAFSVSMMNFLGSTTVVASIPTAPNCSRHSSWKVCFYFSDTPNKLAISLLLTSSGEVLGLQSDSCVGVSSKKLSVADRTEHNTTESAVKSVAWRSYAGRKHRT